MITQAELEQENKQIIINKTTKDINKAQESNSVADLRQSHKIMPSYVSELQKNLEIYIASSIMGKAKVKPVPVKTMTLLPVGLVAHITVKTVVNFIGKKHVNVASVQHNIAKQLDNELNLEQVKQNDKEDYKRLVGYLKRSGYQGDRLATITRDLLSKYYKSIVNKGVKPAMLQVASVSLHLLSESQPMLKGQVLPPLCHIYATWADKNKSKQQLAPANWFLEWIREQVLDGNMVPNYMTPMIEPPKPWVGLRDGGFHTIQLDMIKRSVGVERYNFNEMKATAESLNILQDTQWRVNSKVLEVMNHAYVNKLGWGDMPKPFEIEAMPYPYPEIKRADMNEEQLATVKAWSKHKAAQHSEHASTTGKYLAVSRLIAEAKRFQHYSNLYYTYQVDFRGRIYPVAEALQPQGSEFGKSLLEFSNGKRITCKTGEIYLAMQGANTFGQDKIRLEEKHSWVLENSDRIIEAADNPFDEDTIWHEADEPWLFLAFCFEWAGYKRDPENFESRLPIAMDGSCNGLQHLSAMLRDDVGGRAVNLTNNRYKQDIYDVVRQKTEDLLRQDDSALAAKVLEFGVERKTCKRPVMIVPYAGTRRACSKYIMDDIKERGGLQFFGDDLYGARKLITDYVWQSINETIIKGREVMEWFKDATRAIIMLDKRTDIEWTTPNGFRVIQRRVKYTDKQLQTALGENIRVSTSYREPTSATDTRGHKTAVSPNYIHSLDACALQETVRECYSRGIQDFAMIHDSYGCHAEYAHTMAKVLRRVFYEMYQHDLLGKWINEQPEAAQQEMPELPERGNLDLAEVLDSEHFFA